MYILQGSKCGAVRFEPAIGVVNKETVSRSSNVTDNPIEGGSSISDHVYTQPRSFQIAGTVVNGAAAIAVLDAMWKKGDILTYTGRNRIGNLVIQNLQSTHDPSNRNGFNFTATLKQITIGSSEAGSAVQMMSAQDNAASSGVGSTASNPQTSQTRADGLKTTTSETISASAYMKYVDTYNSKPASSAGPTSRATPSNTGRR